MSSFRIIRVSLLGAGCRQIVASSPSKLTKRLIIDKLPVSGFHRHERSLYGQAGEKYSNSHLDNNTELPKSKQTLLDRVKSSREQFKIISLPNIITTSRALAAPAMGYFIMNNMHTYALACCAYAVFSDITDKYIAHLTNQTSPLNAILDALADKLFIMTSFIALYNMDILSIYVLKSVVVRDFIVLLGGATIRYQGFEDRPTLRQYLDVNSYPTLCFQVSPLNRLVAGVQYSLILAHLAFSHLTGDPVYDWTIYLWQGFAIAMSSFSLAWYLSTWFKPRFLCVPPKQK
jgi:phosphatidylglycerophosphate synthase